MAGRFTTITLRGSHAGYTLRGRKTIAEAVAQLRSRAQQQYEEAKAVMDALDADFHVETHTGFFVVRNREVLQEGRTEP